MHRSPQNCPGGEVRNRRSRDREKAGFGGVVELYFEDGDALKDAFDSVVGREVLADAAEFIDTDAGPTLIVDETVHVDGFE